MEVLNKPKDEPSEINHGHEQEGVALESYLRAAQKSLSPEVIIPLAEAAASAGRIPQETAEVIAQAVPYGELYCQVVGSVVKGIDPRAAGQERADVNEQLEGDFEDAVTEVAESLGINELKPLEGSFKAIEVNGGVNQTPRLRVASAFLALKDPWAKLKAIHDMPPEIDTSPEVLSAPAVSTEYLIMNGCARPLDAKERQNVANYASEANTEYDLMLAATKLELLALGLEDVVRDLDEVSGMSGEISGMPYKMAVFDMTSAKADGRISENYPNIIGVVSAPYDPTKKSKEGVRSYVDRADTVDIATMVTKAIGDVKPGDRIGSISHAPVAKGQVLGLQLAMLNEGVEIVEGTYYKSDALYQKIKLSEVVKTFKMSLRILKASRG